MSAFGCVPAEFEKQAAILLGCNELLPHHPQALVDIIALLIDRIPLVAIVDSEEQRRHLLALLCDWELPAHLLNFVSMPVKGMWVRDYGPSFVRNGESAAILDADYLELERPEDDNAPTELAALLRMPVTKVPLIVEGGNLLSNGRGTCLTTTTIRERNLNRGYSLDQIRGILKDYYGYEQVVAMAPLLSEVTGHVDMFATFLAPDLVVVGEYDPKVDPVNADILDANARFLKTVVTSAGPLRVERIPMPSNRGGMWRTYTNVIFANGVLLVPTYANTDERLERQAMETYQRLLPDWEIVGIDATDIIAKRGALRCVSINIPWLESLDWLASKRKPRPMRAHALAMP